MDEHVMHDVRNYKNVTMMRFAINVVLYAFRNIRKKD